MQLTEGQIYLHGEENLVATFMVGTWVLMRLDDMAMGEVVAYRFLQGKWREMLVTATPTGEELIYGQTVAIDLSTLVPLADADLDERFSEVMGEVAWEW